MTTSSALKVAVIICSTRTPRVGPAVAKYIKESIAEDNKTSTEYVLVDVADFKLPLFDEPILPAMVPAKGEYTKEHTKKWSAEINQYDGYIWVTPEYNYGTPSSTKNAVDFLYNEISGKPAIIASYGIFGGKSSNESLTKTLEGMKLRVVSVKLTLPFAGAQLGPDLYSAAAGTLGKDTIALWDKEHKSVLASAVEELETSLKAAA